MVVYLHGNLSVAGDSRTKIPFPQIQMRGVIIDTFSVVMKMMTGECTDIEVCLDEHNYLVVIATVYTEMCTLAFHLDKKQCTVLYKDYIHGTFPNVDVFRSTLECNDKVNYIVSEDFDRQVTGTAVGGTAKLEDSKRRPQLRLLNMLSVQDDEKGVKEVTDLLIEHYPKLKQREEAMERIKDYEMNGLVKIIEDHAGKWMFVLI